MELLCDEIRAELLDSVSETGGHLASNLGIVELTVALHRVFDTPKDRIVWDVGHQTYVHKMLTGRGGYMNTLRRYRGMSGFPKREESEYDTFDTGHSSNSISAALGMAAARDLRGDDYAVAAVIGDGAFTGGMVYEALNNAGVLDRNFIVILNDNGMSISRNRGSLSQHLAGLRTSPRYHDFKTGVKNGLNRIPVVGNGLAKGASHMKDAMKYLLVKGVLFEELGFTYVGPVDGHDLESLIEILEDAKRSDEPLLVHCITEKGKGYRPAEQNPSKFHGVAPFERETGALKKKSSVPDYSSVFGEKLTEMALKDERITAVSAAMIDGTGLKVFEEVLPERIFDVGIAEEHAVTFAAGLAAEGFRPYVAIYSTFLQRAYDQIMIDVCMQKLPVTFCLDRAGIVGADGETHQGIFDLSYLSHMPNMTVLAPSDRTQLEKMLDYSLTLDGPCAIRYPRGEAENLTEFRDVSTIFETENLMDRDTPETGASDQEMPETGAPDQDMPETGGRGPAAAVPGPRVLMDGRGPEGAAPDVCVISAGSMVSHALYAAMRLQANGVRSQVIDAGLVCPLPEEAAGFYREQGRNAGSVITIEDNVITGGFGSIIGGLFADDRSVTVHMLGWPDDFIPHGSQAELRKEYGLDAAGIADRILTIVREERMQSSVSGGQGPATADDSDLQRL